MSIYRLKSCQISKNEYTFWMPTADIPDNVEVGEHYPQALRYSEENRDDILKYIRYVMPLIFPSSSIVITRYILIYSHIEAN